MIRDDIFTPLHHTRMSAPGKTELAQLIEKSHQEPDNDLLQESVLQQSFQFLTTLPADKHFYCDPEVYAAAVHSLILFSFDETPVLQWLKTKIELWLGSCQKCVAMFHRGRAGLREQFIVTRGIPAASVKQFMDLIFSWESQRVLTQLSKFIQEVGAESQTPDQALFMAIIECFYGPEMFRVTPSLKMVFTNVFNSLTSTGKFMTPKNSAIFPGLIYLLFEGSDQERKWSLSVLYENTLKQKKTISQSEMDSALVEEFAHHLWKIQDPQFYTSATCIQFWCNVIPILHACSGECIRFRLLAPLEMEAMGKSVNYQVVPLWKVLSNHIMSFLDHPLPLLLRAFHCLLVKFKSDFWVIVSPFIFINYIDPIFQNPHYLKYLNVLTSSVATPGIFRDSQPHCNVQDMLRWIDALFESVSGSQRQQAGLKSCVFLLNQEKSPNVRPLFELCFDLLDRCIKIQAPLYDSSFGMELLLRKETRTIFDQNSALIVAVAAGGHNFTPSHDVVDLKQIDDSLRQKAILLVASGVNYDVCNFAQVSFLIHAKKNVTSGVSFLPQLWINLAQRLVSNDGAFMAQILTSFHNVCGIVSIREPTSESVITKHNENVEKILAGVVTMLARFGEFQPSVIKSMLRRDDTMRGLWSCILSFREQLYQTAVDALYECFDVEGRLEGTKALLELNLKGCLSALNGNLSTLISAKFYEPCPRTVRVLMDVIQSLNDPVEGIFVEFEKYKDATSELDTFWSRCWAFLDLIYKETLEWATQYPQDELVDFTRDTLDFSHALLDCYRSVNQVVSSKTLFQDVMATFLKMLVWLRLGDTSLLDSCVALIFKTLDLASELGLPFDEEVIMLLAKYGARARKFNNKLSDQQRTDILERARAFNDELVDQVVSAAEEYRGATKRVEVISLDDDEDTPMKTKPPQITKQSQITKFYEKTSSLPLVERKPHRMSSLEKARADLMKNRKLAKAPAPPRPAGFNRAAAARKDKNKGSGSEESDEDIDSLFNGPSQKVSPRPAPLQPIKKSKRLVDIRKREEMNMRMRLNIDMNPLYRKVLGWSYQRVDRFPEDELNDSLYNKITDEFASPAEYQRTFEPLLLLECWQSIQQQKQVGQEKPFSIVVGSRTSTDSFFDVFASVKKDVVIENKLGDADLVVLAHNTQPTRTAIEKCTVSCLAKVREVKMVNKEFADVTFRVSTRTPLSSLFTPRTELFAMRIMPMVTIEREYAALRGLPYYDLVDDIIKGVPSTPRESDKREVSEMKQLYRVNDSQAVAIAGSVSSTGFSLIQGPPGTGKTKTILGMIGYILTDKGHAGGHAVGHNVPQVVPSVSGAKGTSKKKILLCAPSNAAVDELLMRLRSGIRDARGTEFHPPAVRMGRSDAINPAVKDLTLEEQVDAILSAKMGDSKLSADPAIRQQHTQCVEERNQLRAKLAQTLAPEEKKSLEKKLSECIKRKNDLGKQLDDQRQKISIASRNREIERRNVQSRILSNAQVICATLSGSAHEFLANMAITFDTVVIDEAAQCIELSALIPLKYGCKKCIMVGDPNQLPPTVLSQAAASYKYEQSLFVRMQKTHSQSVYLLDVQYRMHPEISRFPSWEFYHSKLIDGPGMKDINTRPWHSSPWLPPYKFYDIVGRHEQNQRSRSLFNQAEAKVALELVDLLFQSAPKDNWTGRIGIISPYKEQIRVLRDTFLRKHGMPILRVIDFNTVDGFQGQEKEIIIMSCVRSSENQGVGFLGDVRRMNVGLTRARTSLWILGNKESLSRNKVWSALIQDANDRGVVSSAYPGFSKGGAPPAAPSNQFNQSNQSNYPRSDSATPRPRKKLATLDNSRRFKSVSEPPEKHAKKNPTKSGTLPSGPKRGTLPPRP